MSNQLTHVACCFYLCCAGQPCSQQAEWWGAFQPATAGSCETCQGDNEGRVSLLALEVVGTDGPRVQFKKFCEQKFVFDWITACRRFGLGSPGALASLLLC